MQLIASDFWLGIVIGGDVTVDVIQHAQVVKSQWFPVLEFKKKQR
jgi:hypothetical protein